MYGVPCKHCGDILDPGEKCYCVYKRDKYNNITSLEKNGQIVFNFKKKKEPVA